MTQPSTLPSPALAALENGLVVSCQARPGQPLHGPTSMARMAAAAVDGGAVGIRANGVDDVEAIRHAVTVPVIGLWKDGSSGVYITPTLQHAVAVAEAGAHLVAIDATARPRPDGLTFAETVRRLRDRSTCLVLADVSTLDEGLRAADAGADAVATTLSGYTPQSRQADGPDLGLVHELASRVRVPVIAEGRIRTPDQAVEALAAGAWAVVVGTAITSPTWITSRFVEQLGPRPGNEA